MYDTYTHDMYKYDIKYNVEFLKTQNIKVFHQ